MMKTIKRSYDLESYELDNVYNEPDDRHGRVACSRLFNKTKWFQTS